MKKKNRVLNWCINNPGVVILPVVGAIVGGVCADIGFKLGWKAHYNFMENTFCPKLKDAINYSLGKTADKIAPYVETEFVQKTFEENFTSDECLKAIGLK